MGAYVVQARSTEQGIDHGVDKDVSVAVAGYPLFERDRHAAEHERTPADERMNVHADPPTSYPRSGVTISASAAGQDGACDDEVVRRGHLQVIV